MPSIPVPLKGNADSVHDTLTALKMAAEHFMGTLGNQAVTRTFVQEGMPTAYVNGDTWVRPSTGKISYWNGTAWIQTV
jgi:proteasome assembly chaperone (PAC2) family protein